MKKHAHYKFSPQGIEVTRTGKMLSLKGALVFIGEMLMSENFGKGLGILFVASSFAVMGYIGVSVRGSALI